ncbi:hypothetical protein C8J57DRAFT_1628657 [Mycena rebaudengoi]|nr:hypothetical protein C8J57DRAFT_1628657 [Mycena rebaudengoi]
MQMTVYITEGFLWIANLPCPSTTMAIEYPSSTTGSIAFIVPPADGQRAYQHINVDSATSERDRNFSLSHQNVEIENLRGKEDTHCVQAPALEPENANTPDVAGELFLQRDSENYHGAKYDYLDAAARLEYELDPLANEDSEDQTD